MTVERVPADLRKQTDILLSEHFVLNAKIAKACELPVERVPDIFHEVLRFLHLISLSGETLTPSLIVDLAWHEFILCTRAYADYCQNHFGRFIHHHPGGEDSSNRRQFIRTLELYKSYFGIPHPSFWGPLSDGLSACGSCEN